VSLFLVADPNQKDEVPSGLTLGFAADPFMRGLYPSRMPS
jgi:hypothetical protein